MAFPPRSAPVAREACDLSRRIWNLRARDDRGENVAEELRAALAERTAFRCRDV